MARSRREFFKFGSLLALPALIGKRIWALPAEPAPAATVAAAPVKVGALEIGLNFYKSIGVRPHFNCTRTPIDNGDSRQVPIVRKAQADATTHMVELGE